MLIQLTFSEYSCVSFGCNEKTKTTCSAVTLIYKIQKILGQKSLLSEFYRHRIRCPMSTELSKGSYRN